MSGSDRSNNHQTVLDAILEGVFARLKGRDGFHSELLALIEEDPSLLRSADRVKGAIADTLSGGPDEDS